ncbi:hypothetical protein HELRODRAFT_183067 [Helobdella robusta]|uniref:Uncharacterized protein n=1 Tax=Helobdella robusta TaxID=6412 RepID=T1FJ45_HELRO|nr:hypothetical protein HELRODRAFT_183067 [Helobdella robusta]ESN89862.1 hypothetical protein HELRODRAFT_183067 [Helobdella robusta]
MSYLEWLLYGGQMRLAFTVMFEALSTSFIQSNTFSKIPNYMNLTEKLSLVRETGHAQLGVRVGNLLMVNFIKSLIQMISFGVFSKGNLCLLKTNVVVHPLMDRLGEKILLKIFRNYGKNSFIYVT